MLSKIFERLRNAGFSPGHVLGESFVKFERLKECTAICPCRHFSIQALIFSRSLKGSKKGTYMTVQKFTAQVHECHTGLKFKAF